jgi:hypothetical protein
MFVSNGMQISSGCIQVCSGCIVPTCTALGTGVAGQITHSACESDPAPPFKIHVLLTLVNFVCSSRCLRLAETHTTSGEADSRF